MPLAQRERRRCAPSLATMAQLTSLNLRGNAIGAVGALAPSLAWMAQLTSLQLKHNSLGAAGAPSLASMARLTSLNLDCNSLGDAGGSYIDPSPSRSYDRRRRPAESGPTRSCQWAAPGPASRREREWECWVSTGKGRAFAYRRRAAVPVSRWATVQSWSRDQP